MEPRWSPGGQFQLHPARNPELASILICHPYIPYPAGGKWQVSVGLAMAVTRKNNKNQLRGTRTRHWLFNLPN